MTYFRREDFLAREIPKAVADACGCSDNNCLTATVLSDEVDRGFDRIALSLLRYVPGDWVEVPGGTAHKEIDPAQAGVAFFQAVAEVHGCILTPNDLLDECGATDSLVCNLGGDPMVRADCDEMITRIGTALVRRVGVHIIEELPV